MAFRYGFKTEANWYAREMRRELGLALYSPLCPWKLAEHLEFSLVPLSSYETAAPELVAYYRSISGKKDFSAITLFDGPVRWIVHNDWHHPKRQAANIAHELAHGLLLHPPKPPLDGKSSRHFDAALEEEANWLGPALLVSDEAALFIEERKLTLSEASGRYGVSVDLVRMRLNVSGAALRIARRGAA